MESQPLILDNELDAALEAVCAEQGREKAELVNEILRKYVETERLKRAVRDPELIALYQQLADEDIPLAEEGMAEYQRMLETADQP